MSIKKLLVVFVLSIGVSQFVAAQQSILPDISETYVDKLIAVAKVNYPRVRQNEAKIKEARANVGKADISYLDEFSLSYVYQPKTTIVLNGVSIPSQFNGFQAGVFFNLGSFLEKPFAVRQAKEQLIEASADQDEYFLTLANDVKKRYYTYIQTLATLRLQTQATLNAENAFSDIKHKFEKGEQTFENYSSAQNNLTNSYQSKITAETNMLIAKADLEELLGEKIEDVK
jgi:outer membrane protein TolC